MFAQYRHFRDQRWQLANSALGAQARGSGLYSDRIEESEMSASPQLPSSQSGTEEKSAYVANPMRPRHVETVIIGTGFSGLLAAIRLQKKRCNDFVLL